MFEVDVNGLTQQYRTKPTMNVDITGSSGGSVQPDWNQNDDTKPDYVKNRPFYAEPIDGVIFSNDSVLFSDGMAELGEGELSSDSIYTVTFDGTVYDNLVPFYNYGGIIIGSPYDAMSDAMPFCISGHGNSLFIVTSSPEETHSITIYGKGPGIHTIDASYTNIYESGALPFEITWDGNTEGRDSFTAYNKTYYKVSSTYPNYRSVIGCRSMLSDGQMSLSIINGSSNSCYMLGHAIVALIKAPGELYLPKGTRAQAPSTGIYFEKNNAEGTYQSSLTMYLPGDRTRLSIRSPFGKEFSIMVDEDGKLYTKELT